MKTEKSWYQKPLGIIILLILFFPLGLICMWSYTNFSKNVKWAITGLFALFLITGAFANKNQTQQTPVVAGTNETTPTTQPTFIPTSTPKKPQTLDEKIKSQLTDQDTFTIVDATDIDTNAPLPGKKEIDIELNFGKDLWDLNMAKNQEKARMADLTKNIFPMDNSIATLQITVNIPITDAYGKSSMRELGFAIITRSTYNKIHWDSFDFKNIPQVADSYFEDHTIK